MDANAMPRVAVVHDWLTGMGAAARKCLEVLCRRWPHAQLFTLLHRPGSVSEAIESLPRNTSFLHHLPGVARYYRYLLPVMPLAAATWRLRRATSLSALAIASPNPPDRRARCALRLLLFHADALAPGT